MPTSRLVYYTTYVVISAVVCYYMRLSLASQSAGKHLEPLLTGSTVAYRYPGRTELIRNSYTGVKAVDGLVSMLVTCFLSGNAGWRKDIRVQSANFLTCVVSPLVVWSLESVRECNKWSLITFTSLWAILYQVIGVGVVGPIYLIFHTYTTSRSNNLTASQRISDNKARTLVPSVILGYLIPTAIMFYPFKNIDHTMLATGFWQFSPIYVNIIWVVLSSFVKDQPNTGKNHVKFALIASGVIAAVSHLTTLSLIFTSSDLSITSVFMPRQYRNMLLDSAVLFIFQVDYLGIFIASTIWCLQNVMDVKKRSGDGSGGGIQAAVGILSGVATVGPAATLSAVWLWRENRLSRLGGARKAR